MIDANTRESRRVSGRVEEGPPCTPGRKTTSSARRCRFTALSIEPLPRIRSHDDRPPVGTVTVTTGREQGRHDRLFDTLNGDAARLLDVHDPVPGGGNTGHVVGTNIYMVVGLTGVYILDTTTDTVTGSVSGFTGNGSARR